VKLSVYIDQCVLEFWKGKIDTCDAFLIGFLQDLNPDNPEIRKHMWRGHFLVTLPWLLEQLPLLQISKQAVSKRLIKLRELGILNCITKKIDGNKVITYYKLSDFFWKIHNHRHQKATEAVEKSRQPELMAKEKAVNLSTRSRQPELTNESYKDSLITEPPATVDASDASPLPARDSLGIVPRNTPKKEPPRERSPEVAEGFTRLLHAVNTKLIKGDSTEFDELVREAEECGRTQAVI